MHKKKMQKFDKLLQLYKRKFPDRNVKQPVNLTTKLNFSLIDTKRQVESCLLFRFCFQGLRNKRFVRFFTLFYGRGINFTTFHVGGPNKLVLYTTGHSTCLIKHVVLSS